MNEIYQGLQVQSDPEIWVLDWLFELKEKGFIYLIERAPEIRLTQGLINSYVKRTVLKTKTKEEQKEETIISPHYYTPEFVVYWHPSAIDAGIISSLATIGYSSLTGELLAHPLTRNIDGIETPLFKTFIEVKPDFDFKNMTMRFMVNQILAWEKRSVYINLLKPGKLFKSTFTPKAFLVTRKKRSERQIKWNIRSVDEYLKLIGYETPITEHLEDRPHQEQSNEGV